MCKAKYCLDMKQAVVKEYLSGDGSHEALAKTWHWEQVDKRLGRKVSRTRKDRIATRHSNSSYLSAFKMKYVEAVLRGEGRVDDIVAKYSISAREVLRSWIRRYNANKELKDYDPKREVYRQTQEERQRWKNVKRLRNIVFRTAKITKAQLCSMKYPTVSFTAGCKSILQTAKQGFWISVASTKQTMKWTNWNAFAGKTCV